MSGHSDGFSKPCTYGKFTFMCSILSLQLLKYHFCDAAYIFKEVNSDLSRFLNKWKHPEPYTQQVILKSNSLLFCSSFLYCYVFLCSLSLDITICLCGWPELPEFEAHHENKAIDPGSWLPCISLNLCFYFITDLHCQSMNLKQSFMDHAMPQGVCLQLRQPKIPPGRMRSRKPKTHHLRKSALCASLSKGAQQAFRFDSINQIC